MKKKFLKPSITVIILCQQTALLAGSDPNDIDAKRDDEYGESIKDDWN